MASNYTGNYNLNQWAASDRVLRTEFNADNAKIDAAIKAVDSRVDGLKSSKADKTALESLKTTVTSHAAALTGKGNCQLYVGTYTGTGTYGKTDPCSLTFPQKPMMVAVFPPESVPLYLLQGHTRGLYSGVYFYAAWSGNSVSWYHLANEVHQMNSSGITYHVIAFLQAG